MLAFPAPLCYNAGELNTTLQRLGARRFFGAGEKGIRWESGAIPSLCTGAALRSSLAFGREEGERR